MFLQFPDLFICNFFLNPEEREGPGNAKVWPRSKWCLVLSGRKIDGREVPRDSSLFGFSRWLFFLN
jgi:hypothetical protein